MRLLPLLIITALAGSAFAAPKRITVSGYLQDSVGNPVTTQVTLNARLYLDEAASSPVYTEAQQVTPGKDGFFKLDLGADPSADLSALTADAGGGLFLGLQVSGEGEMTPRMRLSSAPWALAVDWTGVQGIPASFPPSAHQHAWTDLTGIPASFPPSAHQHPWSDITGVPAALADGDQGVTLATAPLALSSNATTVSLVACPNGQLYKSNGAGWACSADLNSGGTVTNVTASAPITVATGNSTPALSIPAASSTVDGYLRATDFASFNGKVATTDPRLTDARAPTAGSTSYIQNQTASAQAANFNISGAGTIGGAATLAGGQVTISGPARITGSNGSGNLHLDADKTKTDGRIYLGYYDGKGVAIGTGANGVAASFDTAGNETLTGGLTASGVVHGGGSSGTAFEIGNDAELADVNLSNTAMLRGQADPNAGVLLVGQNAPVRIDAAGNSFFTGGFLGAGPGANVPTSPLTTSGSQVQARFGTGNYPLYVISPNAALGFGLYYQVGTGWVFGHAPNPGFGGVMGLGLNPARLAIGMASNSGAPGTLANYSESISVFQDGSVGFDLATAAPVAGRSINTGTGAYLSSTGVWSNASSRAFKRDIVSFEGALPVLEKLRVVKYRYRADHGDDGKEHIGVIAEELPDEVASLDRKAAPTADLIALSLGANRELNEKVQALEAQNKAQAEKIEKLEAQMQALMASMKAKRN